MNDYDELCKCITNIYLYVLYYYNINIYVVILKHN